MSTNIERPARPRPDAGAYGTEPDGSQRIGRDRRRTPLAWLPWAALAGILALVLLSLLLINAVDDDGPEGSAGDSLGQVSGSDGSGVNGADGSGSSGSASGGAATGAGAPTLTAGNQDLLALGRSGGLAGAAGQPVSGTATVESVVSDEGFWVGPGPQDRVFVYLTPQARQTTGESGFQVKAGQTVQLQGAVEPLAQDPAVAEGVAQDEGRGQLEQQGHFVRADAVQLAG